MNRQGTVSRRAAASACLVVLPLIILAACSGVRNDLGTANSPCYVALPAAASAVHSHGKLIGVRLVRARSLDSEHRLGRVAGAGGAASGRVCLVAFRGSFRAEDVSKPQGDATGPVAIAVLSYPGNRLLGTVVLRHVPVKFGHTHLL